MDKRLCLYCNEPLTGRLDKKYCSEHCKSAYFYELKKQKESSFYEEVDRQLKLNRKILKTYNKAGKSTVRKEVLLREGFNPNFFTHYWKAGNGNIYLFCYEYGFMKLKEREVCKYVLITWQKYMK